MYCVDVLTGSARDTVTYGDIIPHTIPCLPRYHAALGYHGQEGYHAAQDTVWYGMRCDASMDSERHRDEPRDADESIRGRTNKTSAALGVTVTVRLGP
jgi:hypothetical protein